MKFWGLICNKGWKFSEWFFPNVWEIFIQLDVGQILFWSILFAFSRQGLVGKKHLGPDILPLTHKAVGEDALTMTGESRLGHFMSKVLNYLQVLPHTHLHTPHHQNHKADCERTSVTWMKRKWDFLLTSSIPEECSLTTTHFSDGNPEVI